MQSRILIAFLITFFVCSAVPASEGGPAATEQGIFNGSFAEAVWTVLAFVVLLIVLGKFAWKPMLKALKDREEHIKQQIESAETARKLAEEMREDIEQRRLQILQEAADRAQKHEQELIEAAHRKVSEIRHKATKDIEKARAAAEDRLWEQAGDIMLLLGEKVLGRTIADEDNQQLIHDAIDELKR
jgi:F-type H+-transporting ATPase subunit b